MAARILGSSTPTHMTPNRGHVLIASFLTPDCVTIVVSLVQSDAVFTRPLMEPGTRKHLQALHEHQGENGLWFVGSYTLFTMPLLEAGVTSAMAVAERFGCRVPWNYRDPENWGTTNGTQEVLPADWAHRGPVLPPSKTGARTSAPSTLCVLQPADLISNWHSDPIVVALSARRCASLPVPPLVAKALLVLYRRARHSVQWFVIRALYAWAVFMGLLLRLVLCVTPARFLPV